jgi:hypothetical protein
MGTARNFHVKTGMVLDAGNLTLTNGNLLVNSGYIDIDNIKINGQTISTIADDDDIIITPHGTGTIVMSKVDIAAGEIDNAIIGANTAAAGTFAALTGSGLDITGDADIGGTTLMSGAISTGAAAADTTITQVDSAANAAGRTFTLQSGSPPTGGTANTGVGGNLILASGRGKGTAAGGSILFKVADGGSTGSTLNTLATALTIADDKSLAIAGVTSFGVNDAGVDVTFFGDTAGDKMLWDTSANRLVITGTNATTALEVADGNVTVADTFTATNIGAFQASGAIDFNDQAMTNVDINSGAIDGVTIGAATPVAITGTTIDATTDFTVGSTVITDDSIVMTPSADDTVTIAATTHGALAITTVDNAAYAANIVATADGNITLNTGNLGNSGDDARINFQYNGNTRVAIKSGATAGTPVLDVTGNVDISGSLIGPSSAAGVTNIKAGGYVESAHARMRDSDGMGTTGGGVDSGYGGSMTHDIVDIDGTNFYTSENLSITEAQNQTKVPGDTWGTTTHGNVVVLVLHSGDMDTNSGAALDTYQAAEAFCVYSTKTASGAIRARVINKIYGMTNGNGVESYEEFAAGDTALGRFLWVRGTDGMGLNKDTMCLIWQYTRPWTTTNGSADITNFSVNVNGLSVSGHGG